MRRHLIIALTVLAAWTGTAAADHDRGVTLYRDVGFRGQSQTFADGDEVRELGGRAIGNDSVSSVRLDAGCRVTLYADEGFRGEAITLSEDVADLRSTYFGQDRASSLAVECRRPGWFDGGTPERPDGGGGDGVTLYEDVDFRGRSETFLRNDPRLRDNFIRQDEVSSARVAPGCVATLYEHADYRGRSTTLRHDEPDLRGTRVGNDAVSSIRVECRRLRRRH